MLQQKLLRSNTIMQLKQQLDQYIQQRQIRQQQQRQEEQVGNREIIALKRNKVWERGRYWYEEVKERRIEQRAKRKEVIRLEEREAQCRVERIVKCQHSQCGLCKHIDLSKTVEGSFRGRHYHTTNVDGREMVACTQSWVIYIISCSKCGVQYVGKTTVQLNKRFGGHRASFNKKMR